MGVDVIGPLSEPVNAANAANRMRDGATVVVWDPDSQALGAAMAALPATPPGRLCSWCGDGGDPALAAFIREVLDPAVK